MYTEHRIDMWMLHYLFFDELGGSRILLIGLEYEFYASLHVWTHLYQDIRRHQEHGHMPIMSARMHEALGFRGVWQSGTFRNRQRIHIRAEHHNLPRLFSMQGSYHSGTPDGFRMQIEIGEVTNEDPLGLEFRETQLGNSVEISSQAHNLPRM